MAKFELTIYGDTGAELTEGVADLMDQFGSDGAAPAPAPAKKAAKPEPEPEAEEDDGEATLDDVKNAAQRLIAALDNDQERAQALVKEEWGIKQVSKMAKKKYGPFVEWVNGIVHDIAEATGEEVEEDED